MHDLRTLSEVNIAEYERRLLRAECVRQSRQAMEWSALSTGRPLPSRPGSGARMGARWFPWRIARRVRRTSPA